MLSGVFVDLGFLFGSLWKSVVGGMESFRSFEEFNQGILEIRF
jgi:hypothetical protein